MPAGDLSVRQIFFSDWFAGQNVVQGDDICDFSIFREFFKMYTQTMHFFVQIFRQMFHENGFWMCNLHLKGK